MRLCKFEIHNFKGIQAAWFDWNDIVVLIGENNTGKSTVLQALQWFLSGAQIKDEALFYDKLSDGDHAIELIGYFDQLTDAEREAQAVRGRMHGEKWILKKRFWCEEGEHESQWKELYYSYSSQELFKGWPDPDTSWSAFPDEYEQLIEQLPQRGSRSSNTTRDQLRELVRQQRPDLVQLSTPDWILNPGGGGNWKSNANSIIPRFVLVRAVHDATDEAVSKEASSYGKIVTLIIERRLMQRPEVVELRRQLESVMNLFRWDPERPETQAEEIRDIQQRINQRLSDVIEGIASIEPTDLNIQPILLPSTRLVLQDREDSVKTAVGDQGHGLQRTLIMTLVQILVEVQAEPDLDAGAEGEEPQGPRSVVFAIEEPELYMHPQMARKMRDTLYDLASHRGFQVICTTHSPVFLDVGWRHESIVRVVKDADRRVTFYQVTQDLFEGDQADEDGHRLKLVAAFHPTVNEVFFAKRVVLLEEQTAVWAFQRAAKLTGLFDRHPHVMHDVTLIDCGGKRTILMFQRVLNHFQIPYSVVHDKDAGNPAAEADNARIEALLSAGHPANNRHMISPTNIEDLLGYAATGRDRPYKALKRVEELHEQGAIPADFIAALNWVYFGQDTEP